MNTNIDKLLISIGDMSLKRRVIRIVSELELKDGDKVLDIGCAHGYYIDILRNTGIKLSITGADIDMEALTFAKKKYKGKNIRIVYADLMKKLPFLSNTFDKIIMSEVCEHLPDDKKGLREVYRVLKKGGILVLTVPNSNYPFLWDPINWVREHVSNKHFENGVLAGIWANHIRLYKTREIISIIKKSNFSILKYESLTWWSLPFNHNLLYGGKFSNKTSKKVGNYIKRKSLLVSMIFYLINLNDKINDRIRFKNIGVNIIVKAKK